MWMSIRAIAERLYESTIYALQKMDETLGLPYLTPLPQFLRILVDNMSTVTLYQMQNTQLAIHLHYYATASPCLTSADPLSDDGGHGDAMLGPLD